ncbi:MAG: hypothetical protein BGO96_09150 [Micrococcales bacterium 73-15]|mgnify:CR=1 FL=1|uniref:DUF7507 domain-containing protein n=1 Tax=Salana multivorans TaxID=120377 RepID=UPI00095A0228|nr:hypothetical protein [Salana multivorans]OJX95755.1 MAG: hypothetical protein BGO96_09150 [Micrococcales bacterium 73-15]
MTTTSPVRSRLAAVGLTLAMALLGLAPATSAPDEPAESTEPSQPEEATPDEPVADETSDEPMPPADAVAVVAVEKLTNGLVQEAAPGATVAAGSPVEWTYEVTNVGDTDVRIDALTDAWTSAVGDGSVDLDVTRPPLVDQPGVEADLDAEVLDLPGVLAPTPWVLAPGDSATFTHTGVAVTGAYANTATATATPVDADGTPIGEPTEASATSFYLGGEAGVTLSSRVEDVATTHEPGVGVAIGSTVTWTHTVTNTGNVDLTDLRLTQSRTAGSETSEVGSQAWDTLAAGSSVTATTTAPALAGQVFSRTWIEADSSVGDVAAADDTWYYGGTPDLAVAVAVNGVVTTGAPGVTVAADQPAEVTVTVTNRGETSLDDVAPRLTVATADGAPVDVELAGATGILRPGASRTYSATRTPPAGDSVVQARVAAVAVTGHGARLAQQPEAVSATGWFRAGSSGLTLTTTLDDADHPSAPGAAVPVGADLAWTSAVTNTGELPLGPVTITRLTERPDADEASASDPETIGTIESLAPGQSVSLPARGSAEGGLVRTTVTATAADPQNDGEEVTASDVTYYTGGLPALAVVKELAPTGSADFADSLEAEAEDQVTWRVVVTNTGETDLTDLVVRDPLVRETGRTELLAPGETFEVEWPGTAEAALAHAAHEPDQGGATLVNAVTATATAPDGTQVSGTDEARLTIVAAEAPPEMPTTDTRGKGGSPLGWVVLGLLVVAFAGGGFWLYTRSTREERQEG